jgi:hypothetical protein
MFHAPLPEWDFALPNTEFSSERRTAINDEKLDGWFGTSPRAIWTIIFNRKRYRVSRDTEANPV